MMLTPREKYLVTEAYKQGYETAHNDTVEGEYTDAASCCEDWLDDIVADGGYTVEMLLSHEATEKTTPKRLPCGCKLGRPCGCG